MNLLDENPTNGEKANNWQEQTIEKNVLHYNNYKFRVENITIQIKFTSDHQIIYQRNDSILRVEQVHDILKNPELLNNMDQIQSLNWLGQYDQNKKKDGKWVALWNRNTIKNVGGQGQNISNILYFKVGQKQGIWKDLYQNYQTQAKILEFGEYHDDFKIGNWNYCFIQQRIGGGLYNQDRYKQGKWIELDQGFYKDKQVTFEGEYNKKGIKISLWDIMYNQLGDNKYKKIGGGSYDQEGNQRKIGKWVELDEGFYKGKQVTFNGEYNMNGNKIGRWDVWFQNLDEDNTNSKMNCILICAYGCNSGGGSYDQDGNQRKIGKWVELDEGFVVYKQVIYYGEYNLNGKKVGRWDISAWNVQMNILQYLCAFNSGGGSYDQEGNQIKIGKWVDLDERFSYTAQIIHNGEYSTNGIKVDRWDICCVDGKQMHIIIQCIFAYILVEVDLMINLEIRKRLEGGQNWIQCLLIGSQSLLMVNIIRMVQRQVDGILCTVDLFMIHFKRYLNLFAFVCINSGGGSYDQDGNQKKIGKWTELDEEFRSNKQVTYIGDYNMNGMKVGRWDIMYCKSQEKENKQIGGGSYDLEGNQIKIGKWIDLFEKFQDYAQITYSGEYDKKGMKIGIWVEIDINVKKIRRERKYEN